MATKHTTVRKVFPDTLLQVTGTGAADLSGRKAQIYTQAQSKDRIRMRDLFKWADDTGLLAARAVRPYNRFEWEVRQLVDEGVLAIVPERRAPEIDRILGLVLEDRRVGVYIPPGAGIPDMKPYRLVDDRKQFKPKNRREQRQYRELVVAA